MSAAPSPIREGNEDTCAICSLPGSLSMTSCGHPFHMTCLLQWNHHQAHLGRATTCPTCRAELVPALTPAQVEAEAEAAGRGRAEEGEILEGEDDDMDFLSLQILDGAMDLMLRQGSEAASLNYLISAIVRCSLDAAAECLRRYPRVINQSESDGMTPLHYAVCTGRLDMVTYLIARGANVRLQARYGSTPLHFACLISSNAIASKLLRHCACPDAMDAAGETPLFCALRNRHYGLVHLLLQKRANVNAINCRGETIMHVAAQGCTGHLLQLLLDAAPDLTVLNSVGDTPLHTAVNYDNVEFVRKAKHLMPYDLRATMNYIGSTPEASVMQHGSPAMKVVFIAWLPQTRARTRGAR